MLIVLVGGTSALVQSSKQPAQGEKRCTYENCVKRSIAAGWPSGGASDWCSRQDNLIPWCKSKGLR
jgi:hypothetical protein